MDLNRNFRFAIDLAGNQTFDLSTSLCFWAAQSVQKFVASTALTSTFSLARSFEFLHRKGLQQTVCSSNM